MVFCIRYYSYMIFKNLPSISCVCIYISKENTEQSFSSVFLLSELAFCGLHGSHTGSWLLSIPSFSLLITSLILFAYYLTCCREPQQKALLNSQEVLSWMSYLTFSFEHQFKRKMWLLKFLGHNEEGWEAFRSRVQ